MTNRMWGGRFASGPAEIMEEINASIAFDKRLAPQDIRGSLVHAAMLAATGILSHDDVKAIQDGLKAVAGEIARHANQLCVSRIPSGSVKFAWLSCSQAEVASVVNPSRRPSSSPSTPYA